MPAQQIGAELSHERQQAAPETNLIELLRETLPAWHACTRYLERDLTQGVSGLPIPLCNAVAGARFSPDQADARIRTAIGRADGAPMLWKVGPTSEPADLGERLLKHGFTKVADSPGMILELSHLQAPEGPVPGLSIGEVMPKSFKLWAEICQRGFGMPDLFREALIEWMGPAGMGPSHSQRHLLAYMDEQAVATATLVAGSETAGIYNVATLKEYRRKGIGAAITVACCEIAKALGYRYAVLEASSLGAPVYQALGFVERCKISSYAWKA